MLPNSTEYSKGVLIQTSEKPHLLTGLQPVSKAGVLNLFKGMDPVDSLVNPMNSSQNVFKCKNTTQEIYYIEI